MKLLRLSCFLASSLLFIGCGASMPDMPDVKTQAGRNCMKECQRDHNVCLSVSRGDLFPTCNQKLTECYQLCLDE